MAAVSVIVVAFDAGEALTRCLASLRRHSPRAEIVVVNNGAPGPELARAARLKQVTVLSPGRNLGFAAGCNLGASQAGGEVLVFLNPDTLVAPGAVQALAAAVEDRSVGIATARLRLLAEPERLNAAGNVVHVTGLAWSGGYGTPVDTLVGEREVPYPSGAAMALRADLFHELGGFREELFLYHEDLDLGWRARMRGLRVVVVPEADVFHDYDYGRNAAKSYFMERNRLVFLLTAFSGRLLLVVAPLLLAAEGAVCARALREGWLRDKLSGWAWCARNAGLLRRLRRETQAARRVPDRELARFLTPVFDPGMAPVPWLVGKANPLLARYWQLARRAL